MYAQRIGAGVCLGEAELYGYLTGRLPPPDRRAPEEHLLACDDCREKLAAVLRHGPAGAAEDRWVLGCFLGENHTRAARGGVRLLLLRLRTP